MREYEVPFCHSDSEYYMGGDNYEEELSGLTRYLMELNEEFRLNINPKSIDVTLNDKGDEDETTEVSLKFTMCNNSVDVLFETNRWGYMPAPKESLLIEVGRARSGSNFNTNFYEVYLKTTGKPLCDLLEDHPRIYFGSYEEMLNFQLLEEATFRMLGGSEWERFLREI